MSDFPQYDYTFRDRSLLTAALTHSSYANENRGTGIHSNERLEFLGDSVLGLVCARYIFETYKHLPEGELTKLRAAIVCEGSLYELAERLELGPRLLLGNGERHGGGDKRPSVLADATEAVLAAIYLDSGMEAVEHFLLPYIREKAELIVHSHRVSDYKTALQEIVQKNHQETLSYRQKDALGPDHDKRFVVEVLINSNVVATGEGKSKKLAEQNAARAALELMGEQLD